MATLTLKPHSTFHRHLLFIFYFYFFLLTHLPAAAQLPNRLTPPPPDRFSELEFEKLTKIVTAIYIVFIVAMLFLILFCGCWHQCIEDWMRLRGRDRGLDREIIDTFPTFVYSTVKNLKICAVCLNEFKEDETLRLIPKCSHVFHPDCIDPWLANHSTCPLCRANLVPKNCGVGVTFTGENSGRRSYRPRSVGNSLSIPSYRPISVGNSLSIPRPRWHHQLVFSESFTQRLH